MDWDAITAAVDQAGALPDAAQREAALRELLDRVPAGEEGHAEVLTSLGSELLDSDQVDAAREAFEGAIGDGGRTVLDPQVGLLATALRSGDDTRADDLLASLLVRSRAERLVLGDYEWIAESLESAGRLREALRWFTIPLRDIQPGDLDLMPPLCLDGRWRVRRALGLPVDAYDEAHDLWHEINDDLPTEV